ncbi:MAG: hypothetical protein Edafosvirus10_28 [Edafosvirus sp.]|uniref:phenylalanine--tRNA ligase n=1 Tax=Edafosvirus sp. TaxID=2487765 RepID=A0A3G4ZXN2_9VIRU|nr:MAG: hypothetical protein Edafosvirus10_28 [Edafosvirus sp.]
MDKLKTSFCNISPSIENKIGLMLHNKKNHPISIIKNHIYNYFRTLTEYNFITYDDLSPIVSTLNNFDLLRIPKDHVARSKSDTYYVNETVVLRTHTSAHQNELLEKGISSFLVTGDVYRKDEIDQHHFPVFTQMEGLHLVENNIDAKEDLIKVLSGLIKYLFPNCEFRINDDYFPFTHPSFEIEVNYNGKWIEVLGCGIIHHEILDRHNIKKKGWAFGLGLDRLAMILFEIPDIRMFWSTEQKFLNQFASGEITKFKMFSKLDTLQRDISFWINDDEIIKNESDNFTWKNINSFYELVREIFNDDVEKVVLYDKFYHDKKKAYSHTFRLYINPIVTIKDPGELTSLVNKNMILFEKLLANKLNVKPR